MRKSIIISVAALALAAIATTSVGTSIIPANAMGITGESRTSEVLSKYSLEGYAEAKGVTGGGILEETNANYYKVGTATEFLKALYTVNKNGKASVIELTNDIALGSKEVGSSLTAYKSVITASSNQPLLHPTLLKTGVSQVNIKEMKNLTIYSKSGAKITHACFNISKSSNIIIRNITFDEIWEWDEATSGNYDRNDWDYITLQNACTGIWIDHCTFYKAYDGIVDVKKASATDTTDVTVSWSRFLPGSEGEFFDCMMEELERNKANYAYYNKLRTTYGMTAEQVYSYANGQKKTHLFGASDSEENIKNLRVTLANNYYKNSMDRLPRLRGGYAHVYNTIMDSADLYKLRNEVKNSTAKSKIVSNGAISTCGASVLVQNSYMDGIVNALLSGNGNSTAGYIGAMNCNYVIDTVEKPLTVTDKTESNLVLDTKAFLAKLPYSVKELINVNELYEKVYPYVGAGVIGLSGTEWMSTEYKDLVVEPTIKPTVEPTVKPTVQPTVVPTVKPTTEPTVQSIVHNFTENGKVSEFFTIAGSTTTSKGTVLYEGMSLKICLKMESATNVAFTTDQVRKLKLIFNSDCSKKIEIDGQDYAIKNGVLEVELAAGAHSIKKSDTNVNLYFIELN
ncbi:MAG: hypothetical protein Q4G58_08250 [bacterium]|nr:hypothetical protein [bacterium]